MCKKLIEERMRVWVVVTLFLLMTGAVYGDMIWVGYGNLSWGGSLDNWYDASTGALATYFPTTSINVPMPMPACTIEAGTDAESQILWIAPWVGNPGDLTMDGGTLTVADYMFVGSQDTGHFTVNDGAINVANQILIGANPGVLGYMTMNGGTIDISVQGLYMGGNGVGELEITGGTIITPEIGFGVWGDGSGTINFNGGGQITILGTSQLDDVLYWMGDGEINNAQLNVVSGNLVLTQVPEPVTLALLGIGSMVLLRRRK